MHLLFATTNANKTREIIKALPDNFTVSALSDINLTGTEVDEPYSTLKENALHKALSYHHLSGLNCFSEDTGLEVDALNGRPGVYSARYAGIPGNDKNNIDKLLTELNHNENRNARFRTVMALIKDNEQYIFEGICEGRILTTPIGLNGFGYDSVFLPNGADKSFAEMSTEEKNIFSHRKKALFKMISFLKDHHSK
jgi:XTP/dITP diphosphohydrolase